MLTQAVLKKKQLLPDIYSLFGLEPGNVNNLHAGPTKYFPHSSHTEMTAVEFVLQSFHWHVLWPSSLRKDLGGNSV